MRVEDTCPPIGTEFDWDIAEILEGSSCDLGDFGLGDWDILLADKRNDEDYPLIRASIERWGFIRPLTAYYDESGALAFGDGHHRLAAAIDLGLTSVPVRIYEGTAIAEDSGAWDSDCTIEAIAAVEVFDY